MKQKCPNFIALEDKLIAKAWVNISEDPIVGVGQKNKTFWERVHEKFVHLRSRSAMPREQWFPRTPNSLEARWKRPISVEVKKWMGLWAQLEKEAHSGGWNYKDYPKECHERFKLCSNNRVFKLLI